MRISAIAAGFLFLALLECFSSASPIVHTFFKPRTRSVASEGSSSVSRRTVSTTSARSDPTTPKSDVSSLVSRVVESVDSSSLSELPLSRDTILQTTQKHFNQLQIAIAKMETLLSKDSSDLYASRYRSWIDFDDVDQTLRLFYEATRRFHRQQKKLKQAFEEEGPFWLVFDEVSQETVKHASNIERVAKEIALGVHDHHYLKLFDMIYKKLQESVHAWHEFVKEALLEI
jgi:hypothetical protein